MPPIPRARRRRLPSGRTGEVPIPVSVARTGEEAIGAGLAQFGRGTMNLGQLWAGIKEAQGRIESDTARNLSAAELEAFELNLQKNNDVSTYQAEFKATIQSLKRFRPKNPYGAKLYDDWLKTKVPLWEVGVAKLAVAKTKDLGRATLFTNLSMAEQSGDAAEAVRLLQKAVDEGYISSEESAKRIVQVQSNIEWFAGVQLAESNPDALMGILDDPEHFKNLNRQDIEMLRNRARTSQGRIKAQNDAAYKEYVEKIEQDWLVKLRNNQLTENEIISSTLEVDKKQEWLDYIDKQAEEILAGEDITTDESVKGDLESMAYDIFTDAISLPDFQKELKKARYIDKTIDDGAYDEIFSLAQREYKSYQAQALKTATDDAARQLIDVRTELDLFALLQSIKDVDERKRILSERQIQFWHHSQYRKALNDWFSENPKADADEIYIQGQKLLTQYRRRTVDEIRKLLRLEEERVSPTPLEEIKIIPIFPGGIKKPKKPEAKPPRVNSELPSAPKLADEYSVFQKVRDKWYKLPANIREEINAALLRKFTWQQIVEDDIIKAELAKIK